jgi:hypothetical protein
MEKLLHILTDHGRQFNIINAHSIFDFDVFCTQNNIRHVVMGAIGKLTTLGKV